MDTIIRPKNGERSYDNGGIFYLTYNKQGYVSTVKYEYPYKSYKGYTATFSYNKDGCLTSIDGHESMTLEWKSGCIIAGGPGYGRDSSYNNVYTFYYVDGNNKNVTRQYSVMTAKMLYEEIYIILAHLGLLGKGPAYLPDDYTNYVNGDDEWEGKSTNTPRAGRLQYTFNSVNGVIEKEKDNLLGKTDEFYYNWGR